VQVPGYIEHQDELRAVGIDEVIVYCVNDGAVMDAWAQDQKIEGTIVSFFADPYQSLTNFLGMNLDHPGPISLGLTNRCKRNAIYFENGVAQFTRIAESPDDPAGDDHPEITCAPSIIEAVRALKKGL